MTPTAQDQLSAYLDGELSDEEVRVLEQALEGDAELRHQLARLERVQNLLRTHGPVLAPEGFTERVQAAVADEPRVAVPWWKGRSLEGAALLLAAAAALLIALPSQTSLTDALSPASRNETVDKRDRYEDAVAAAPEERMAEDPLDPPPSLEQADLRGRADEGMSAAAAERPRRYCCHAVAPLPCCCRPVARLLPRSCHAVAPLSCGCPAVAKLLPLSCHAVAMQLPLPCVGRAVATRLPCTCHASAVQLPSSCHALDMQFPRCCHAVTTLLQ